MILLISMYCLAIKVSKLSSNAYFLDLIEGATAYMRDNRSNSSDHPTVNLFCICIYCISTCKH